MPSDFERQKDIKIISETEIRSTSNQTGLKIDL